MGRTGAGHATVSVNSVGALDVLQTALTELLPREKYTLWLMDSRTAPFGTKQALVTFQANASRAQIAQAIGPLRKVLAAGRKGAKADAGVACGSTEAPRRYLMVTHQGEENTPVLMEADDR
jgi:hypothetical protein